MLKRRIVLVPPPCGWWKNFIHNLKDKKKKEDLDLEKRESLVDFEEGWSRKALSHWVCMSSWLVVEAREPWENNMTMSLGSERKKIEESIRALRTIVCVFFGWSLFVETRVSVHHYGPVNYIIFKKSATTWSINGSI